MLSSRPNLDSGGNIICHLRQSHISNIKTKMACIKDAKASRDLVMWHNIN